MFYRWQTRKGGVKERYWRNAGSWKIAGLGIIAAILIVGWDEADRRLAPPRRSPVVRPVLVTTTAVQVALRALAVLLPGRMAGS
jgi:hypothetical protein